MADGGCMILNPLNFMGLVSGFKGFDCLKSLKGLKGLKCFRFQVSKSKSQNPKLTSEIPAC